MLSDNGKTFKAAARMLRSIVSQEDAQRYLLGMTVKWEFNLLKAPWRGGSSIRVPHSIYEQLPSQDPWPNKVDT